MLCWFSQVELVAAKGSDPGELVWRFPVQKEYLNVDQLYAGGAQAAVHDVCTAWALLTVAKPGYWASLGSTRSLNMSFLKSASQGDIIQLKCKVSLCDYLERQDSLLILCAS